MGGLRVVRAAQPALRRRRPGCGGAGGSSLISITHFRADDDEFAVRAQHALAALSARPGFVRGTLGRSTDDDSAWLLVTEWENVGSYRRALANYDVKLQATPLLGEAL
ncbi:MAG TPA: antibiotic biosynthesis monooxygenase family protein, partial [Jatrophihabitantaceae bacterium]|nr:antibiotic biosynthesis monooxygenase family protein [Jatrophihabitantaceae bacterium]